MQTRVKMASKNYWSSLMVVNQYPQLSPHSKKQQLPSTTPTLLTTTTVFGQFQAHNILAG